MAQAILTLDIVGHILPMETMIQDRQLQQLLLDREQIP